MSAVVHTENSVNSTLRSRNHLMLVENRSQDAGRTSFCNSQIRSSSRLESASFCKHRVAAYRCAPEDRRVGYTAMSLRGLPTTHGQDANCKLPQRSRDICAARPTSRNQRIKISKRFSVNTIHINPFAYTNAEQLTKDGATKQYSSTLLWHNWTHDMPKHLGKFIQQSTYTGKRLSTDRDLCECGFDAPLTECVTVLFQAYIHNIGTLASAD